MAMACTDMSKLWCTFTCNENHCMVLMTSSSIRTMSGMCTWCVCDGVCCNQTCIMWVLSRCNLTHKWLLTGKSGDDLQEKFIKRPGCLFWTKPRVVLNKSQNVQVLSHLSDMHGSLPFGCSSNNLFNIIVKHYFMQYQYTLTVPLCLCFMKTITHTTPTTVKIINTDAPHTDP